MTQPINRKKPRKTSPTTKVISAIAGVVLVGFLIFALTRGSNIREYNRLIELINAEKYDDAQKGLESFLQKDPSDDLKKNARTELAKLYARKGDEPTLPFQESGIWYRKANDLDPTVLGEHQRTLMNTPAPTGE